MTYRPTPSGLARDASMLLYVLRIAQVNMKLRGIASTREETTAGTWNDHDDDRAKVS